MDLPQPDQESMINAAATNLRQRFAGVDPTQIETLVRREVHALSKQARVNTFVGIIAERHARAELARVGVKPSE